LIKTKFECVSEIRCFWLITSKLTLPTEAYFCPGGSHMFIFDVLQPLLTASQNMHLQ